MPSSLYSISFTHTGHVLAIASFEKQTLADADAATALLEKLVSEPHLTISSSSGNPIRVSRDLLALDPIAGKAAPADIIANPWGYQVQAPLVELGNGKEKTLVAATANGVTNVTIAPGAAGLKITIGSPDAIPQRGWVLLEGATDPLFGSTLAGGNVLTLTPTVPVASGGRYGLVFLKDGIPTTAAYVTA